MREQEKCDIKFVIQVDTMCHRLPHFIEKAGRAGVARVFIGLESINPDSLLGAHKKQNKITEYRKMLLAWKKARRDGFRRLHPRLPGGYAGDRSCAISRSSSANCRSICSSSTA